MVFDGSETLIIITHFTWDVAQAASGGTAAPPSPGMVGVPLGRGTWRTKEASPFRPGGSVSCGQHRDPAGGAGLLRRPTRGFRAL